MPECDVSLTPEDLAAGKLLLDRYAAVSAIVPPATSPASRWAPPATYGELYMAQFYVLLQTEWIVFVAKGGLAQGGDPDDPIGTMSRATGWIRTLGDHRLAAGEPGEPLRDLYDATLHAMRLAYTSARRVRPADALPPGGVEEPGLGIPPLIIAGVVAIFATAAFAWWAADKNEKVAQVEIKAAELSANLARYQTYLAAKVQRGEPLGPAPDFITSAAAAERGYPWWALGTGLALGIVGAWGLWQQMSKPSTYTSSSSPPVVANPYVREYKRRRNTVPRHWREPRRRRLGVAPYSSAPPAPKERPHPPRRKKKAAKKKAAKKRTVGRYSGPSVRSNPKRRARRKAPRKAGTRKTRRKRNPSSTRTEVRSPTRTATSTKAHTQGNITVTGGAGAGDTSVSIRRNPKKRAARKAPLRKARATKRPRKALAKKGSKGK